ncbi:hypothetical protein AAFC00_004127 [Neodothiora populina]|uniref:Nucleoporin NUP37 n=1 Tax=Neodothiora populina TaxID=2781224 RepID=A0ABR3PIQ1_9PEZI
MFDEYDRTDKLPDPHVSRHGRRAHLRYETSQRLYLSKVYPTRSHRGAEVIVSGHEDGVSIIWKGGKPLSAKSRMVIAQDKKDPNGAPSKTEWNGVVSAQELDQAGKPLVTHPITGDDRPAFSSEEQEPNEDGTSIPFTQELNLSLGSPVLDLAFPTIPPPPSSSPLFDPHVPLLCQTNIVFIVVCADASVKLITIPLTPPSASAKRSKTLGAQICTLFHATPGREIPRAATLTWTSRDNTPSDTAGDTTMEDAGPLNPRDQKLDLLVAVAVCETASALHFFRVPTEFDPASGGRLPAAAQTFQTVQLAAPAQHVSFSPATYPSPWHSQLLLTDAKGMLRIYDPLISDTSHSRPSSRDSVQAAPAPLGAWVISFSSPFHLTKETLSAHSALARRKSILDACWVSAGRSVMALFSDGEWGIWNVEAAAPKSLNKGPATPLSSFALRGFIAEGSGTDHAAADLRSRSNQRLAPMTPNTRRVRQESLFSGPTNAASGNARRGGISAVSTHDTHGSADDSIVLWFGGEAYHVPSLISYWQRSVSSSGKDVGSLYGPGLARIEGLEMCGEILNNVAQFPAPHMPVSLSGIAHNEIIVTGEYRFTIITTVRPETPARSLFTRDTSHVSTAIDLHLLEKGELDLGGVDRLLDDMGPLGGEHINGFGGRPKRVGFAR